jgi:hypothetical protein
MYDVQDTALVEEYLRFFLKNSKDFSEFSKYFRTEYLKRLFYTEKLLAGETFDNVSELVGSYELEELMKRKEISISNSNNHFFKAGEEISLFVDIKNI